MIGYIGLKLIIITITIGVALLSEKYIGKSRGLSVGYIIGLFVGGLLFMGLQLLYPYVEKLDAKAKTFKRNTYTEKYGRNFPQPTPEDFGITQDEFKDYKNRFQFEYIKLLFTYGLWFAVGVYTLRENLSGSFGIYLIGGTAVISISINHLFDYWNKKISQRHRYYEKINQYQQALKIYFKIRDENSTF
ncbi:MAG: hypothetical protein KDD32_07770 [Bacteroidetes bacterium]|nr:hypothetical protein [Bacteroidota bacterium]